jgi:hypothetical protein
MFGVSLPLLALRRARPAPKISCKTVVAGRAWRRDGRRNRAAQIRSIIHHLTATRGSIETADIMRFQIKVDVAIYPLFLWPVTTEPQGAPARFARYLRFRAPYSACVRGFNKFKGCIVCHDILRTSTNQRAGSGKVARNPERKNVD